MEYVPLLIIVGILSACAIAAYELLDVIERDEFRGPSGWSDGARVAARGAASTFTRVSPNRSSAHREGSTSVERAPRNVRPDSDRLDVRIRGLEARLERLERECDRIVRNTSRDKAGHS